MDNGLMEWTYRSMMGCFLEGYGMPGVENAFAEGSYCMKRYADMLDAYERLCDRLGVEDVDDDAEAIIRAFLDIQRELCFKMYGYGARFGKEKGNG